MKFKLLLSLLLLISATSMVYTLKNEGRLNQIFILKPNIKGPDEINIAKPQINILRNPPQSSTKAQEECIQPNQDAPVQAPVAPPTPSQPKSTNVQLECTFKPDEGDHQIITEPEKPKEEPSQDLPEEAPVQILPPLLPVCPQPEKPKEELVQILPKPLLPVCPQPEKPKEEPVQILPKPVLPICPQPEKPKEEPVQIQPKPILPVCPQPEKPKEIPVQTLPGGPSTPTPMIPSKLINPTNGAPRLIDCEDWFPKDCCWWGFTVLPKSFWVMDDLKEGRDFIVIGNNNNYLSSDQDGNLTISKTAGKNELWRVVHKGDRMINLLSFYGGYLSIHENGSVNAKSRVACIDSQIHVLHSFNRCELDDINYAAFRAINGMYLSFENNDVSGVRDVKDQTEIFKGYLWDETTSKCLQPIPAPEPIPVPVPIPEFLPEPEPIPAPAPEPDFIPPQTTDETEPLPIPEAPISPIEIDDDEVIVSFPESNKISEDEKKYILECRVNPSTGTVTNTLGQGAKKKLKKILKSHFRS